MGCTQPALVGYMAGRKATVCTPVECEREAYSVHADAVRGCSEYVMHLICVKVTAAANLYLARATSRRQRNKRNHAVLVRAANTQKAVRLQRRLPYLDQLILGKSVAKSNDEVGRDALSTDLHGHELLAEALRLRPFGVPLHLRERLLVAIDQGVAGAGQRCEERPCAMTGSKQRAG